MSLPSTLTTLAQVQQYYSDPLGNPAPVLVKNTVGHTMTCSNRAEAISWVQLST